MLAKRARARQRLGMSRLCVLLLVLATAAFAPAAEFPAPHDSGSHLAPPEMSADAAAGSLQLPEGFRAAVFAAEPDVRNPIAMAWDGKGRLWIAENYTYAERTLKFDPALRDRVLIFSDDDGDGRFDSRRVFSDTLQRLTGLEVGLGGVWLMCPPHLLFVRDADLDGVPDSAPEVMLDGFNVPPENHHNFANGLRFGPDGWLYGRCGGGSPAEPGVPGTPQEERPMLRGTMWRYHPQRRVVEVLGSGTTNPWGHDWDRHGELFFINTVNGHLWHGITGARYARLLTLDVNPHAYELIDMHADHWHFDTAQSWQESRDGAANVHGGGHAHVGMMIYQGDNWPEEYRNNLYTLNFHGRRANREILERRGSGYVGRHAPDFFVAGDTWFRGMDLATGPDGGVFVIDWSDTGECHNSTGVNRNSGRIFKITYGEARRNGPADLAALSGRDLAALHTHANDWYARQARLELARRALQGHKLTHATEDLLGLFESHADPVIKLRALWTLYTLGAAKPEFLRRQLDHANEHVRTWAVRLLTDDWPLDRLDSRRPAGREAADADLLAEFVARAKSESSALVRLALATVLQRVPVAERIKLALALGSRREDATDHNLPLLVWYGLIPLGRENPRALASVAGRCELHATRRLAARMLTENIERDPGPLDELIAMAMDRDPAFQTDLADGMREALRGWRQAPKPAGWDAFARRLEQSGNAALRERLRELSVVFGDGRALADMKALVLDTQADMAARQAALRSLIEAGPPDLREICEKVLRVRYLNIVAARGLAKFDDPAIGERIAAAYPSFHHLDRTALIETLLSRPAFARALLAQIPAGRVPRAAITPYHARQIRSFGDPELNRRLQEIWGELREPAADKRPYIEKLRAELTPEVLAAADRSRGRVVYNQLCASCHRLYGEGGAVGPDLTGSGRENLDYLLENIVDPNAVVTADFRMCVVRLRDGRTLTGFIAGRTARTLTVRGMTETHTIERDEVAAVEELPQSMMPEGLLETQTSEQRRDLIAYLMHPAQVPLPEELGRHLPAISRENR